MFLLYFVPYALMVRELGATFKNANSGVSSWVNLTMGTKWTYYAGGVDILDIPRSLYFP